MSHRTHSADNRIIMKKILSNKYNMKETIRTAKKMRERERIASQHRNMLGQEYAGLQITLYFKGKRVIVLMLKHFVVCQFNAQRQEEYFEVLHCLCLTLLSLTLTFKTLLCLFQQSNMSSSRGRREVYCTVSECKSTNL